MPRIATRCTNPKCSCLNCTCVECHCGAPKLGDLEQRIMAILWEVPGQQLTGREVADVLGDYAYTTVATILDRLVKKDAVSRRKEGRAFRFTATDGPATRAATLMREALGATEEPDVALARFVQTASPSEAEALRRALGQLQDPEKRDDPRVP